MSDKKNVVSKKASINFESFKDEFLAGIRAGKSLSGKTIY